MAGGNAYSKGGSRSGSEEAEGFAMSQYLPMAALNQLSSGPRPAWQQALMSSPFLASHQTQALLRDDDRAYLSKIRTNAYVWGEGFQVDPTQDYSNFTPKKIQ